MTDLSEESAFGAGRNAFAVWPRPVTVKRLSSFRPGGQERPGLAEAAGLLGRFMLTRLRGCWREEDRPRAPQTVVGGRRVAWAPPLGGSLLGGGWFGFAGWHWQPIMVHRVRVSAYSPSGREVLRAVAQ